MEEIFDIISSNEDILVDEHHEEEVQTSPEPRDVWENLFDERNDIVSSIWFCEFSFPVGPLDGEPEGVVRELVAATSKKKIIEHLASVVFNPVVCQRTGFGVDSAIPSDLTLEEFENAVIKDFFTQPGRNLYITLVPLI